MARTSHLISRFARSLRPGGPRRVDDAWACSHLLAHEEALWRRMSNPDRRHAVAVARRVERSLGHEATRPVLAAALLHDVGKVESGLRTYGRVVATLSAAVAGRDAAGDWKRSRGYVRRIGLYLDHPKLGGDLLEIGGSDALTVAWAREHHLPADRWTLPAAVAAALAAADDD